MVKGSSGHLASGRPVPALLVLVVAPFPMIASVTALGSIGHGDGTEQAFDMSVTNWAEGSGAVENTLRKTIATA